MVAFNPGMLNGVEPRYGGGNSLAIGKHPVVIVETLAVMTKDNAGGYISLKLEAIDGPSKGGNHTDRLNVHNTNETTVRIALSQLAAYCAVVGINPATLTDTDMLKGKPFIAEIGPQKNDEKYNEVKSISRIDGQPIGAAPAQQQQQAPAAFTPAPAPAPAPSPFAPTAQTPAFGATPAPAPAFGAPGGAPAWARPPG